MSGLDDYEVLRDETIPCVTDQWNFPHDRNRPWVHGDGHCSICKQPVDFRTASPTV